MPPDNLRQDAATSSDDPRPAATSSDSEYTLSIEDALARYEAAGLPRTTRSVQRYCAKGDLDAHRIETPFGEKFLITPASVDRHIAYINEVRPVATGRDLSRQDAPVVAAENKAEMEHAAPATTADNVRQGATENIVSHPVAADHLVVELLKSENEFLREQIKVKDKQIAEQSERSRETNVLINGLQRMLSPLLGSSDQSRSTRQSDDNHYRPDQEL